MDQNRPLSWPHWSWTDHFPSAPEVSSAYPWSPWISSSSVALAALVFAPSPANIKGESVEISDRLVYELKPLLTAKDLRIRLLSGLGDVKNLVQNALIPNASCHFKGHQIHLHSYHCHKMWRRNRAGIGKHLENIPCDSRAKTINFLTFSFFWNMIENCLFGFSSIQAIVIQSLISASNWTRLSYWRTSRTGEKSSGT